MKRLFSHSLVGYVTVLFLVLLVSLQARQLWANGVPASASTVSSVKFIQSGIIGNNCTYSHGYWKNHPESWPVSSLDLGALTYSQEELLEVLDTPPRGDATYILAYQWIAAKLNVAQGADESALATTISDADSWFGENPLGSDPSNPVRAEGIDYANRFDEYNNGQIGPGHCDENAPTSMPVVATNTPTSTPTAGTCPTPSLGAAADFNVFMLGDLNQSGSDTEGRMAVGGNVSLSSYSVGDKLDPKLYSDADILIAGGDLTFTSGRVYYGNAVYGGSANVATSGTIDGELRQDTPIDFAAARLSLHNTANSLAALAATGTTTVQYWDGPTAQITLDGEETDLNVFFVSGTDMAAANTFTVNAPAGSTVLVNIDGTSGQMENFGFFLNGVAREQVLYNFYEANTLTLQGVGIEGSILAPYADISFTSGVIRGHLIGQSLTGGGQSNYNPFDGCLPTEEPTATSTPRPTVPPEATATSTPRPTVPAEPTATPTATLPPREVINLRALGGQESINVEWNLVGAVSGDLDRYELYRSANGGPFTSITTTTGTQYPDNDPTLTEGIEYCYQVKAVDSANNVIGVSNIDCARIGQLTLWVPHEIVQPNATNVPVAINLANGNGLCIRSLDIRLSYDQTIAQANGTVLPTIFTTGYAFEANTTVPGEVKISSITGANQCMDLYGAGTLFNVHFDVIGAEGQISPLDFIEGLEATVIYDSDDLNTPVNLLLQNGSLTVGLTFIRGDLNGDGVVNAADAAIALDIASGSLTATAQQQTACDVNGDGACNSADSSLILCYAAYQDWAECGAASRATTQAANGDPVQLKIGPAPAAQPGDTIRIPLEISNGADVAGANFAFTYDASKMTATTAYTTALTSHFEIESNAQQEGILLISLASNQAIASDDTLLSLEFTVISAISSINFGSATLNDASGRDLVTSALQRQIQLVPYEQTTTSNQHRLYLPVMIR